MMPTSHEKKGSFTISIDYEYAWGFVDRELSPKDILRIRDEASITSRLIDLFEHHRIPATWAIVGHLLEAGHRQGRGPAESGEEHGEDPAWFDARGLVARIAASSVGHEIGSHSYAHPLYGEIDRDAAMDDIGRAAEVHTKHKLPFRSFVFPRNKEGHHDLLKDHGITCFRGLNSAWYDKLPYRLWPLGTGIDYWLPTTRTVIPTIHPSGLVNIPDSIALLSRKGLKRLLPPSQSVRKLCRGLDAAARRGETFHLWFHPSNFSYDTETQFKIFDAVLAYAVELRDRRAIDIVTMGEHTT